jgi:sortase A
MRRLVPDSGAVERLVIDSSRVRRLVRDISSVLIISGLLLVLDAGVTLIWQEPVTAAIGAIKRGEINHRFESYNSAPLTQADQLALHSMATISQRVGYLARQEEHQVSTGDAIGSIDIPKIGANFDVVQGTDTSSLQKGPGHYPSTAFPGLGQTVAIAGHRTTYLAPFRRLNELRHNDQIVVKMRYARFTYIVQKTQIVLPTALWVVNNVGYERLVLSACNPLYSAAQRIIVFARLAEVQPLGAARVSA